MAKNKYCYAIVNKENGYMLKTDERLPIYWNRKEALEVVRYYKPNWCITPINLVDIEKFILTAPY